MSRTNPPAEPRTKTELERALLDAGRSYRSSPEARARTLAALGLSGSAALSAGAAAAVLPRSLAKTLTRALAQATGSAWGKALVGVSMLGLVAAVPAGYYVLHRGHRAAALPASLERPFALESQVAETADPPAVVTRVAAAPAIAPRAAAPATATAGADAPEAAVAGAAAPPAAAASAHSGARAPSLAAARSEARPPAAPALREELAALDAARAALAGGDPAGALSGLDAYARAYPGGRLALEAEILRIEALAQGGRGDLARQRAEAFLRRHPKSVLAARARGYLGD
jgi:hypothetical protein